MAPTGKRQTTRPRPQPTKKMATRRISRQTIAIGPEIRKRRMTMALQARAMRTKVKTLAAGLTPPPALDVGKQPAEGNGEDEQELDELVRIEHRLALDFGREAVPRRPGR